MEALILTITAILPGAAIIAWTAVKYELMERQERQRFDRERSRECGHSLRGE